MAASPWRCACSGNTTWAIVLAQSASARALAAANGPDLSSGSNFRRAQIGFQGKLFGDWSYFFNTEFGGSNGFESQGRVQSLYIQYDGLKPWAFRIGAYPPPGGLEDNTSSQDTIFLERAGPSDILRNSMGGDGRDAATLMYVGDDLYAAVSWTGAKVADAAVFDEQNALLARLADSCPTPTSTSCIVLSGTGFGYIFKVADLRPRPSSRRGPSRSRRPRSSPSIPRAPSSSAPVRFDTSHVTMWGVEAGAQWQNFYGRGRLFPWLLGRPASWSVRRPWISTGWYAQAILGHHWREARPTTRPTQHSRRLETARQLLLRRRRPGAPVGTCWPLQRCQSERQRPGVAGSAVPVGGIRGGDQRIFSVGLNLVPQRRIALHARLAEHSGRPPGYDAGPPSREQHPGRPDHQRHLVGGRRYRSNTGGRMEAQRAQSAQRPHRIGAERPDHGARADHEIAGTVRSSTSSITNEAVDDLGLKVGDEAIAVIKASDVGDREIAGGGSALCNGLRSQASRFCSRHGGAAPGVSSRPGCRRDQRRGEACQKR